MKNMFKIQCFFVFFALSSSVSFAQLVSMHDAIKENDMTTLKILVVNSQSFFVNPLSNPIDAQDKEGNTPLHYAVLLNRLDMVEFLLENEADTTILNHKGQLPLHDALMMQNDSMIKLLALVYADKISNEKKYWQDWWETIKPVAFLWVMTSVVAIFIGEFHY